LTLNASEGNLRILMKQRFRDRSLHALASAPFQCRHWETLARMFGTYDRPVASLGRYLWNGGHYPWRPQLRTPMGTVSPLLESYHDLLTVNEVFCRRDYGNAKHCTTIVDIGANVRLAGCPETPIGVHDYAVSILWDLGQGLKPVAEDVVSDSK